MTSGLEAKQVTVKGKEVFAVVHSASGRSMLPRYGDTKAEADAMIANIYRAIPEADWTKTVAELVSIPNLQVRLLKA